MCTTKKCQASILRAIHLPMDFLNTEFNRDVKRQGENIFKTIEDDTSSIFNKDWWYGRILDWSMKNEQFKTQMFRFVDVLPYLNSSSEVTRHLKEYFAEMDEESSKILNFGLGVGALAPGIMAAAIRKNVTQMAKMFITGENPESALPLLRKARENSIGFTADLLGEAALSQKESLDYQSRYIELINWLCKDAEKWPANLLLDQDDRGALPRVNISVKLTALYSQVSERAWEESIQILKERIRPIFTIAKERGVFINIDMEQYKYKDLTLQVFRELTCEPEFKNYPHFGIVIQAYLRDSLEDILKLIEFAKVRGTPITIRLVKGAYWDHETIHADQMNWQIPVFTNKQESDHNFERCAEALLKNIQHTRLAAGTHNVRSIAATLVMAEKLNVDRRAFEIQMLFGMADPIKKALVKSGYRVREYATIGELIPGMAYLVRRLLENTSNESFLRSKFAENISTDILLKDPAENLIQTKSLKDPVNNRFYNEPLIDWAKTESREQMRIALTKAKKNFGENVRPVINGKEISNKNKIKRENPANTNEIVGHIELASIEDSELAIASAQKAYPLWSKKSAQDRAAILLKLAEIFRREKFNLIALQIYEVGKNWTEADGDVCEAIDFLTYYAAEAVRLAQGERTSFVNGEDSHYKHRARGIALVISPWNFPLAILTGQVAASIVTGNTCIMKPAEQSSIIAARLMKYLDEAGCPKGVVSFLPGLGEEIGRHLVSHKDVSTISFTGSMAVGLEITKACSALASGQQQIKRAIIEMGGKNAIIIDSDADLDEAVIGVLYSSFGFQGQKCSACSRVIVLEENYDRFLSRLIEAAKSLVIRKPEDPHSFVGPVVDKEAFDRIRSTIEKAKSSARLVFETEVPDGGFYVSPTIFADVNPNSELAQEEIFGPVLAVIKVKDLDEAIHVANGTKYALTGGLFSRSPANISRVREDYECGNLYINRGITGAMVGRHPFGGYKMSGLGSKTGGKEYLLHYMDSRVVTENTVRRGFAPPEL